MNTEIQALIEMVGAAGDGAFVLAIVYMASTFIISILEVGVVCLVLLKGIACIKHIDW